jgi:hypothetical protein
MPNKILFIKVSPALVRFPLVPKRFGITTRALVHPISTRNIADSARKTVSQKQQPASKCKVAEVDDFAQFLPVPAGNRMGWARPAGLATPKYRSTGDCP